MEAQNPSFMEENELISFPLSKVIDEEEYLTWEQKFINTNSTNNPKKRRLVITTMLEEPILIEIRPNLGELLAHPLVSNSTQCNVIENRGHKRNTCLEHMNLWNELYQAIHDVDTLNFCEEDWFEKQGEGEDSQIGLEKQGEGEDSLIGLEKQAEGEDSLIGMEKQGEGEDSLTGLEKQGEGEDSVIGLEKQGEGEDSLIGLEKQGEGEDSLIGLEKQGEREDSLIGLEKQINCNELWPKICAQALDKIIFLKQNIKKTMREKEEEKERCKMLLTKQSDLEKQIESEKAIQNQDCKKLEAVILELKNQITSQAEEIRRLWIENLANESDELITKSNDIINEEETPKTKQHIIELEHQLAKAQKQHKIISKDQEIQCEFHMLNDNEYSKNEELQYQEKITLSSSNNKNNNDHIIDYESLVKERDNLKKKLEKVNYDFNRTTSKLRENVAKRRRLEAESEGEKEQRSNLAAALYELESEVEETISTINSLQSTTCESMATLTNDLQNFEEALEKRLVSNNFESYFSIENDDEMVKLLDSDIKQNPTQNLERTSSNIFKGIPDTESIISKLTKGHENLLIEIRNVRKAIHRAVKSHKCQMHMVEKEMTSKLQNIEFEKETLHSKIKVFEEENKSLQEDNSRLQQEVSSLKHAKSTLNLQLKDLEKEMEDFQESLKNLREENRRLLKEAKWKSVGKQGGYQESLIVHEWEKKLQKLEGDYELLRHAKKDLVKEKHRLEDELDRATEKGYKGLGGSENRNLEEELSNMTQERNKLRKIKITLAIENVSLKESLAELRIQVDTLENECMALLEWKEKTQKLEEECEDLRDWKKKAEALEVECKDLHNRQMKVEAHEFECQVKNSETIEFEEKHQSLHENIETVDKECQGMCNNYDCYEEECKSLCECKANLEKECERLCQRIGCLEKDQNTFCKFKEKLEKCIENNEFHDLDKLKMDILECGFENLSETESKVEEQNNTLHQLDSTNIEYGNVQEYLEKIASLEQENLKLCQNHQIALDKQWDVLQGDMKAFEIKIEELENECESIRRDHLSSMVENAELVREKERLLTLYNDQKYNYEILETSNECLQKDQEQKESERMKERNDYQSSIDNLNRQIVELESSFSERLHQQASNYELCLGPKIKANGQETITLSRQEYEILLAEKAVMLQERDSAHKKLCSAEVQNLQLNASIECLRKELPCSNQGYKENGNDAEVLLAQDIVNLRSMVSSLEEELEGETCERNKLLEMNKSMRGELNQLNEALLRCQHENQNLNISLDELKRRSSLEQIHSAASSLKDQLGKASKEKDLIKEQLTKAIKEKEQLTNVANERDKVINSLKEKITKLEKGEEYSFKTQLQDGSNNKVIPSEVNDQSLKVMEENSNVKEVVTLKHELQLLNNDLIKKTKLWQKERSNFEEKCRRLEVELMNTREAQDMIKKKMEDDLQEAMQTKNNLELIAKNEIKGVHVQVLELEDELSKAKNFFDKKFELATKEMEYIGVEINLLLQEMKELKENKVSVKNEKENISFNGHSKDSIFSSWTIEDANQSNLFIPKTLLEQGIQVMLQEDLKLETKIVNYEEKETTPIMDKDNDELMAMTKERDFLMLIVSQLKMEKNNQIDHKDTNSCNGSLIQVPKCEDKLECYFTLNENHNIQISENKEKSCIKVNTFNQNLHDFEIKVRILNEQLLDLIGEKDQLKFANQSLLHEKESLIDAIAKLEAMKETMFKNVEQDLNLEISSLKALLAIVEKEKEQLANSKESLCKKLEDHFIIVQSLNEQLESLSYEKNSVVHAKEIVTLERDSLLDKNSALQKQLQAIVKIENTDSFQKDTNDTSSSMYENIPLLKDHENLIAEIVLLKKENEDIEKKLEVIIEQNCTSLNNYRNALDRAQCDLDMKNEQCEILIKENTQLKEYNVTLFQTKNHLVDECKNLLILISLVKIDNKEMKKIFREEMVQLTSLKNELLEVISKKNQINSDEDSLIQHLHLLKNEKLHIDLQASTFNNAKISMNEEQQISVPNTIEIGILCSMEPTHKLQGEFTMGNKYSSTNFMDVDLESPNKELEFFKQQKDEITNERNNLVTLLKETKQAHVDTTSVEIETLKQKLMLLDKKYNQLVLDKDNVIQENKFMKYTTESLSKECDNLFTTITSLKDVKLSTNANSTVEHQSRAEVDQSMDEKEKESIKLEKIFKEKFNEFAKKIAILIKEFIASTKEREKIVLEMTSLKRECQKLHTMLNAAERDKDNLMKSVLESRSTIDRVAGEISLLRRELVEIELKLTHLTIERDNANLQIVDLQRLLNNHNRMQHLQGSYSLNKFENLEAQNRCLRMEKDVMEDQLKKCSMDLEGNYQFEQPLPSMANFKIQKIDSHLLAHPSLHNSSQLFLTGTDSIGRPRPPHPSMLHQQWPI